MDDNKDKKEKDGFGLEKDRRLVARRERKEEVSGPESLDPPFPYRVISIDPNLYRTLAGS